ncbi:DivIVA domain-containing protein [Fusibacter tunisiensis]|uniref:Cell division initiation protein n=1 Tax=Fusibacter tunisiensis TaxID=1008308 RepID=A0ABS2MM89_9FIRM|nr:DivIVA domain-containing protein [Fusibacter tunisiensis]MBM7560516.1 cell division initiation protein [Fusibacter tunisiensis]
MLTPLDIQNKHFSKVIRGFSETEVEQFLADIVKSMEDLIQTNIDTTAQNAQLEREISKYQAMEKTIHDAVVLAQKTSDDLIHSANEKAKYIVERAEDQAKKTINDANTEVIEVLKRHEAAKMVLKAFQTKFKVLLESELKLVDEMIINAEKE